MHASEYSSFLPSIIIRVPSSQRKKGIFFTREKPSLCESETFPKNEVAVEIWLIICFLSRNLQRFQLQIVQGANYRLVIPMFFLNQKSKNSQRKGDFSTPIFSPPEIFPAKIPERKYENERGGKFVKRIGNSFGVLPKRQCFDSWKTSRFKTGRKSSRFHFFLLRQVLMTEAQLLTNLPKRARSTEIQLNQQLKIFFFHFCSKHTHVS